MDSIHTESVWLNLELNCMPLAAPQLVQNLLQH
jgi:hypothetical protein